MKKNKNDVMEDDIDLIIKDFDIWKQNSLFRPKREFLDQI